MRKVIIPTLMLLVVLVSQVQAATIHMRFFESTDVTLDNTQLQVFSVSMLHGELLTVVAYGMDEGVIPSVTLINPQGSTVAEDFNTDQQPVAYVQHLVPANGMYTFIVSRQGEVGGLIRTMVFEGEPLQDGTLIDTLDPFAPSRAFMLATAPQEPISVSIDVIEPDDETIIIPEVFGSRGTAAELPPLEERITPLPDGFYIWENGTETPFYTINVRPFPEILATSLKTNGYFDFLAQSFEIVDYILCVGECSEPERVNRDICEVNGLEIVGVSLDGQFFQVVDPNSASGYRLVPASSLTFDPNAPGCERVQPVDVSLPTASSGSGGGNLFGLPPSGNPPPADGDGVDLFDPTPPPGENPPDQSLSASPPDNASHQPPAPFAISFSCAEVKIVEECFTPLPSLAAPSLSRPAQAEEETCYGFFTADYFANYSGVNSSGWMLNIDDSNAGSSSNGLDQPGGITSIAVSTGESSSVSFYYSVFDGSSSLVSEGQVAMETCSSGGLWCEGPDCFIPCEECGE